MDQADDGERFVFFLKAALKSYQLFDLNQMLWM